MRLLVLFAYLLIVSPPASAQQPDQQNRPQAAPGSAPAIKADPRKVAFGKSLNELRTLFKQRRYRQAIPLGQRLVEQARAIYGERSLRYTGSVYNLGLIYNGAKRYKDAAKTFKQAFIAQHPLRSPADKSYKRVLSSLANINRQLGRPRDTGQYYLAALKKLRQAGQINSPAAVYYYAKAGQLMRYIASYSEAEDLLRHALDVRRKITKPDHIDLVAPLNALAGLLRARGKFAEAEPLYKEAIQIQTKVKGEWNASTGILLDNIAVMYLHMGQPEKAEPLQKRALAIIEKTLGRHHRSTGITLGNLAELYRKLGRPEASEKLFLRALTVLGKALPPNHPHIGVVLDNLAGLYRGQGNNRRAYETYRKAIARLRAAYGPDHPEVGVALNNIGLVLGNLGRNKEAEARFVEAFELARKAHGDDSIILSTSLANLADIRIVLGKLETAEADARRALSLITKTLGPQHRKLIFPLTRLGEIEKRRGNIAAAFEHFQAAAKLYEVVRQRGDGGGFGDNGAINSLIEAAFDASSTQSETAGNPYLHAAFRFSQLKTLTSASDALNKLGARLGAGNPELRALARERQDVGSAWAKADQTLLKAVSAAQKSRDAKREAGLRAQILIYSKRLKALDDKLAQSFPQFAELSRPRAVTAGDIQNHLATDEVLLQYLVAGRRIYGWAISKRGVDWRRIDLKPRDLRNAVDALRCGLDQAQWIGETKPARCFDLIGRFAEGAQLPFSTSHAHKLYEKLVKPFDPLIAGRKLFVVSSDALTRIPLHLLLTAPVADDTVETLRDAPWLIRRHAITDLPSVSSFVILRQERAGAAFQPAAARHRKRPYFAVANPLLLGADGTNKSASAVKGCPPASLKPAARLAAASVGTLNSYFRGGKVDIKRLSRLEPLPETAAEVCAVARDLGAPLDSLLLGASATESAIRQLNRNNNRLERYRILHFATHGLVNGEVDGIAEPALVLSPPGVATPQDDGILTASEVAELKLDADWVILSACNTAAGTGTDKRGGKRYGTDALSGLARSFFYAGARSLLVSHWPVRSDAAVALTTRAIATIKGNPSIGRSAAMRRAMLSVIADRSIEGAAHPEVWAPFVVVGEGTAERGH
ncbi:MAG: tetratricopeptide repeat protein [Hyphomicrobiaceae bacterium]